MTEQTYESLLDFPTKPVGESTAEYRALERAHTIRMFEIDLYWKRSTYFWILQASVFAGLGLTMTRELSGNIRLIPIMLGSIGFLSALAGHLSAKGSKFWQQNWEKHIDRLENFSEGNLHKSLWMPGGNVSWSVTGVNDTLTMAFTVFWITATVTIYRQLFKNNWVSPLDFHDILGLRTAAAAILIGTVFLAIIMLRQKSGKGAALESEKYTHLGSQAVLGIRKLPISTPPA